MRPLSCPTIENEHYVIFETNYSQPLREHFDKLGIGYKNLLGLWEGKVNPAFIVNTREFDRLRDACWLNGQDCVLHLGQLEDDGSRCADLEWLQKQKLDDTNVFTNEGTFKSVSRDYALAQDAWTKDGEQYFVAE